MTLPFASKRAPFLTSALSALALIPLHPVIVSAVDTAKNEPTIVYFIESKIPPNVTDEPQRWHVL